jgi:hypothetical protein
MKFFVFVSLFVVLFSCGTDTELNENQLMDSLNNTSIIKGEVKIIEPIKDDEVVVLTNNGMTLTEIKSPENKEASIKLNTKQFKEGVNRLQFSIDDIEDYTVSYLANNYSLEQFSSTNFDVELMYGNNVFLAFLTDKKNLSIKTNKASVLKNTVLGGDMESLFDMNQPHLFYYLPQAHGVNPILDFYLINTSISENGNNVKVIINETEFILNKWAAYQIEGLPKPDNTIRIQLLDKNGNLIEGPFNDSGERAFSLINKSSQL